MTINPDEHMKLLIEMERAYADGLGDPVKMLATSDEVLKNDPKEDLALFVAAAAHSKMGNDGIALQLLNVAAQIKPDIHEIWHNMAASLGERSPEEAYKALLKANSIKPDERHTLVGLVNYASQLGRHAEALDYWERHKRLHGFDKNGAVNASFALFHLGRWEEAWKLYKGSLGSKERAVRNYHADSETPRWRPDKHEDATVVLYGEQGIGDEIMFASLIPRAVEAADEKSTRLIIECSDRVAGLFARSFAPLGVTVYGTRMKALYAEDWQADEKVTHKLEFGGLGEFFAPAPFQATAYLKPDPAQCAMWRAYLDTVERPAGSCFDAWAKNLAPEPLRRPKIGIAWTGGAWATGRHRRSIQFKDVALFIKAFASEADFVCLEYEDRREDLEMLGAPVINPHWATRKGEDYDQCAALVSQLDLVIAPTTSIVDLCGALGVECWAMVDANPVWRYSEFCGPDEMFFYKSVRVIRQEAWGNWSTALQVLEADFKAWLRDWRDLEVNCARTPALSNGHDDGAATVDVLEVSEPDPDKVAACKDELLFWFAKVGERAYNHVVMTDPDGARIKNAAWQEIMQDKARPQ